MATMAPAAVLSMIHKSGKAPVPGPARAPASADSAAPPPIIIAPDSPLAVPARCGRTDSAPAVALGMSHAVAQAHQGHQPEEGERGAETGVKKREIQRRYRRH